MIMELKDCISLYAALISTAVLTWQIIQYRLNKKSRLWIYGSLDSTLSDDLSSLEYRYYTTGLTFRITNLADRDRHIALLSISINGIVLNPGPEFEFEYPITLKQGIPFKATLTKATIENLLRKFKIEDPNNKRRYNPRGVFIALKVIDTTDRVYKPVNVKFYRNYLTQDLLKDSGKMRVFLNKVKNTLRRY